MNWKKLKIFKKIAQAGSFLTASKQDNKSQSTFSRAVMDLEREK
jgi:DNA-binding transcriptional LysR family regulator